MSKHRLFLSILTTVLASGHFAVADGWLHPTLPGDRPVWGLQDGIAIGIPPTPGPRGLIRIYTPYLHMSADRMINFVAIEPTVKGKRDLSELEASKIDRVTGKHFDAVNQMEDQPSPQHPTSGLIERVEGVERMSLYLLIEPFSNGAHVSIKITFRADRPDEVTFETIIAPDSAPMESCVLTATMGNYAILRHLKLRDRIVEAHDLFAHDSIGVWDFYPWHEWPASDLIHEQGQLRLDVTGDGDAARPTTTPLPASTEESARLAPVGWRYEGQAAEQSWFTADRPGVVARVNGRRTYWGTTSAIPGGAAFENVELSAPFEAGQTFIFRVTPQKNQQ